MKPPNLKPEHPMAPRMKLEDTLHFARKHEQRVWGSGSEHEKARAEVERLEILLSETPP